MLDSEIVIICLTIAVCSFALSASVTFIGSCLKQIIIGLPRAIAMFIKAVIESGLETAKIFKSFAGLKPVLATSGASSSDVWSPNTSTIKEVNDEAGIEVVSSMIKEEEDLSSPAFIRAGIPASYFSEEECDARLAEYLSEKAEQAKKNATTAKRQATRRANQELAQAEEQRKADALVSGGLFGRSHDKGDRKAFAERFKNFEGVLATPRA